MLNMDGIQTPVPLSSIDKFENQNPKISVNVLYLNDRDIIPIRTSKLCNQCKFHVNLLMLTNQDKFHYTSVQYLLRLVGDRMNHQHKTYVCHYCLHPFSKEDHLKEHLSVCSWHQPQQIVYLKPGKNILKFDKFHFQFDIPFAIYTNFESFFDRKMMISQTCMYPVVSVWWQLAFSKIMTTSCSATLVKTLWTSFFHSHAKRGAENSFNSLSKWANERLDTWRAGETWCCNSLYFMQSRIYRQQNKDQTSLSCDQ